MKTRMRGSWIVVSIAVATALVWPRVVGAQLLVNPSFDDGIEGWSELVGLIDWDEFTDVDGDPASGCLELTSPAGTSGSAMAEASCVRVFPNAIYDIGAYFHIAGGQDGLAHAMVSATPYPGVDCTGSALVSPTTSNSAVLDDWFHKFTSGRIMPAEAHSVHLRVSVWNGELTSFVGRVDDVYLTTDALFGDAFESGGIAMWSASVGDAP